MTTHAQVETQDRIARLENSQKQRSIGLGAAMGLNIRIITAEDLFEPVNSQLLDLIYDLTPSIISAARVAFRIFIGKYGPHRLHDGLRSKVLGGYQFDSMTLTFQFFPDEIKDKGVVLHGAKIGQKE
jgi:hypothetical protein